MNKEEFALDEKTYENQDGMIIKIVFSNLGIHGLSLFGRHKKTKYLLLLLYIIASSLFMAEIHTIFFMTFTIGFLQPTQHDKNKNYYFLHMADIQPTQNFNKIQNTNTFFIRFERLV